MKSSLIIAILVAVLVIAGAAGYLALTNQNSPTAALINAKRLLGRNFTATYQITIAPTAIAMNGGIPGIPIKLTWVSGYITISRTPLMDATVINGTLSLTHYGLGSSFNAAFWKFNNELCFAVEFGFMGVQAITHCVPYVNITSNYVAILNESRYIGAGVWDGRTTYCFSALITTIPTNNQYGGFEEPIVVNVTKMCLLSNGVLANATIYAYPAQQQPLGSFMINVNLTLINYSFTFNQEEFTQITRGLIPG